MINEYAYEDLRAAATAAGATAEDLNNLGKWFEQNGRTFWNGEYYDADGLRLYPIYTEIAEDNFEITGYEFK